MEMWHWVEAVINFSSVTYWYIMPDDVGKNINLSKLQDATFPVTLKLEDIVH